MAKKSRTRKKATRSSARRASKAAARSKQTKASQKEKFEEAVEEEAVEEKAAPKTKGDSKTLFTSRNVVYVLAIIAVLALVGWRLSTFSVPDVTQTGAGSQVIQEGSGPEVGVGDTVTVNYTGTLANGEVFDSGQLDFTIGAGEMIEGFDDGVRGMKEGGIKTFTVPADKAYGEPDPEMIIDVPLVRTLNKTVEISTDEFVSTFGVEPVVGETYFKEGMVWNISVLSVNGNATLIEHMPENGTQIESAYGTETVTVLDDELSIKLDPAVGQSVSTVYGPVKIASADEDSMKLDFNSPLAGEDLTFTVQLVNVTKGDATAAIAGACSGLDIPKADVPKVELFIMSYCPYGLQMQKAMLPVMDLLGDKADFSIKWVSYAMHGEKEIDENTNQYCIEKEFPDKYIDYASCFTVSGDSASCMQSAGIDTGTIDTCIAEADEEFNITGLFNDKSSWVGNYPPYMVDAQENQIYGVRGSPTTVINGKVVSVNRSPEDVKQAVCCAFNQMPEECGQTLSSTAASPGIGGGTGTANTASCS